MSVGIITFSQRDCLTSQDTEEDPSTRKPTGSPTTPETTTSPSIIAQQPVATSVTQHTTTPLSHLSMDGGVRQASAHFTMTSSQCSGVPVTSCYDVYGGATLAGNGNTHVRSETIEIVYFEDLSRSEYVNTSRSRMLPAELYKSLLTELHY